MAEEKKSKKTQAKTAPKKEVKVATKTTSKETAKKTQTTKTSSTAKKTGNTKTAPKKVEKKETKEVKKEEILEEKVDVKTAEEKIDEIVSEAIQKEEEKKEKQEKEMEELETALEEAKKTKNKKNLPMTEEEHKQLEKIRELLREKNKLPREEQLKVNEKIFFNLLAAIVVIVYFIFINRLYFDLSPEVFLQELRLFSLGFLFVAIVLFEFAYRKDSGKIAINGIEFLSLAIVTMLLIYVETIYMEKFPGVVSLIGKAYALYFLIKSIVINQKAKKEYSMKKVKEEMEKE